MPPFREFYLPRGVTPIPGEPLRFYVASRSRMGESFLVDIQECGFNGCCNCEDFSMRHLPELKRDRRDKRPARKRRCFHIKQAMYYFAEVAARLVAAKYYKMPDGT